MLGPPVTREHRPLPVRAAWLGLWAAPRAPPLNAVGSGAGGPGPSAQPQAPELQAPVSEGRLAQVVPTAECPDKHCPWTGRPRFHQQGLSCVQPWVCPLRPDARPGQCAVPLGRHVSSGQFSAPAPRPPIPHQEPSQHPACPSLPQGWGSQPTAPGNQAEEAPQGKSEAGSGRDAHTFVCVYTRVYALSKPVHWSGHGAPLTLGSSCSISAFPQEPEPQ